MLRVLGSDGVGLVRVEPRCWRFRPSKRSIVSISAWRDSPIVWTSPVLLGIFSTVVRILVSPVGAMRKSIVVLGWRPMVPSLERKLIIQILPVAMLL